jgi:GNAT superfamily N-acetyltransferase
LILNSRALGKSNCGTLRENMSSGFEIRRATVADAEIIARHRARMFQEMGLVPDHLFNSYKTDCETRLRKMLATGEYVGWLASPNGLSGQIVAGVGAQLRNVLPHPVEDPGGEVSIAEGRHAIIINVFTEPQWRRHGVAKRLLAQLIAWARGERLDRLVLHASDEGRALYEKIGFIQTNEMRFKDRLDLALEN